MSPSIPLPPEAMRLPGRVVLKAYLNRDGIVKDAELIECSNTIFYEPARNAIMRWRFRSFDSAFPNCEYCYKTIVVNFVPDTASKK